MQALLDAVKDWTEDYIQLRNKVESLEKIVQGLRSEVSYEKSIKKLREDFDRANKPSTIPPLYPNYPSYPGTPLNPTYPVWTITSNSVSGNNIKASYVKS